MLSPLHKHALLSTFLHIESRLREMEALLAQGSQPSPLDQHVYDLSPTETKVVQDYFARIRTTMVWCLEKHGIPIEVHRVGLRWSLQAGLNFLRVAVAEVSPDRLRGYGHLEEAGRQEISSIQQEIDRILDRVLAYLGERLGHNLSERIARLDAAPGSVAMLGLLDRIVTRWQLVEFRPAIDTIVQRLESPQFEVAVFGRVSSGKSSLLNSIAGQDVLPVGVTPITAVPTRLLRGARTSAVVHFAEVGPRTVDPKDLAEFASEEKNPGNRKHVTGITVEVPSPRLPQGVVFVDTPGIGALATRGSAETFAYLPRCDLSVVLIDAGSVLNHEDLRLLRELYEAGIPAQVLLSKADLLTPEDRQQVVQYTRQAIWHELDLDIMVHPVSVVGKEAALLERWFEQEIAPLWTHHRMLVEQSLHRKIARLRQSVLAVLRTLLAKRQGKVFAGGDARGLQTVARLLGEADAAIQRALECQRDWPADEAALADVLLQQAAQLLVQAARNPRGNQAEPVVPAIREWLVQAGQRAREVVTQLQSTLSRVLEAMEAAIPLARTDAAAVRNAPLDRLPGVDLSPLSAGSGCSIPGWATLVPPLASWLARRAVERHWGEHVRQFVRLQNAQLHAWLKKAISAVAEPYQSQAEVFREQWRRMTTGAEPSAPADTEELIRDLEELERADTAETQPAADAPGRHVPFADGQHAAGQAGRSTTSAALESP